MTIEATFENGVFVPCGRPEIAEHERVRLVVLPISPVPEQLASVARRRAHRIRIDGVLAEQIARGAEFHPDEW